jgi:hypothetical protein
MRQMLNLPVDVITHLQGQDNMSAYVARLVRQDKAESFEDKVKRIVNRMFAYGTPQQTGAISDDINTSIKSIFNL